jgi:CheY-like chemotaxis protein
VSSVPILVVCGDAQRRASLAGALLKAGWEQTRSAAGMCEAARLLHDARNACVVLDADLADIPGLTAAEIMRHLCPHIKVIFTAPENSRDLEAQVRALDVFFYYISSGDPAELVEAIRDAVGAPRADRPRGASKVLIVDDDDDFQVSLRAVLEPAGYSTVSAHSIREGLEAARREAPDAILLDIIMGSTTDGFEFCHEARRDPQLKHTPILGISAIEEKLDAPLPPDREPELFPVDAYLRKPVEPERLLSELGRLVRA